MTKHGKNGTQQVFTDFLIPIRENLSNLRAQHPVFILLCRYFARRKWLTLVIATVSMVVWQTVSGTGVPDVSLPERFPGTSGEILEIPIQFFANQTEIAAMSFAIDYDQRWLTFDSSVNDPFVFTLPSGMTGNCAVDATNPDGEITCSVDNGTTPPVLLENGVFLTFKLRALNVPANTLVVIRFASDPSPTFYDPAGNTIEGLWWSGSVWFETGNYTNYLPLILRQLPSPCTELIVNGDFENRDDKPNDGWGWELPATNYTARFTRDKRYEGEWSLLTGITDPAENTYSYASGEQIFTIPSSATSATLTFWDYPVSGEAALTQLMARLRYQFDGVSPTGPNDYDIQYVAIQDITAGSGWEILFWQISDAKRWQQETLDLSDYIGHKVQLRFTSYNDGYGGVTAMYVDNVSVQACDTH